MDKDKPLEPIDSALYAERIYRRYHKHYLAIPYKFFDTYLKQQVNAEMDISQEIIDGVKAIMDAELVRSH